ncbi:MAG: DnaJ domain-containing protein [Nitrospirota bacterium]
MERRKHSRIPHRLYLTLDDIPGRNIAFTGDVSSHGILIETNAPLTPGRSVAIKLTLPTGKLLNLIGQVRWAARNHTATKGRVNQYGVGVSIQRAPEEFQRFVASMGGASLAAAPAASAASPGTAEAVIAAHEALKRQNHYDVLGVAPDATAEEVKRAYYALSRQYHPDVAPEEDPERLRARLEALTHRIAEAYVILSSERRRERYNRSLGLKVHAPIRKTPAP